ncbi:MAG: hypothetical protein KBT10_07245 [Bacteroidales bacterium]|nr:hypothetical protein [Candidatus Sodaliphilus aphodohippi]
MKKIIYTLMAAAMLVLATGCEKLNNKEVHGLVHIDLGSPALWTTYGVSGFGTYRIFNRAKGIPANFPYNVNTYTGYGGVVLIVGTDISTGDHAVTAYETACPVENRPDVSVDIAANLDAVCPKCGSHYNVLTGSGSPVSGVALTNNMGLTILRVFPKNGGYEITSR